MTKNDCHAVGLHFLKNILSGFVCEQNVLNHIIGLLNNFWHWEWCESLQWVCIIDGLINSTFVHQISRVRTVTRVWIGQSGVGIQAGARDSCLLKNIQNIFGPHLATSSVGTGFFSLTIHLHLMLGLRMSGVMPLLPSCIFSWHEWRQRLLYTKHFCKQFRNSDYPVPYKIQT